MSYLDDYKEFSDALVGGTSTSERIRLNLINNFQTPSYTVVEAKTINEETVTREINTTRSKKGVEQLILSHPEQPFDNGMMITDLHGYPYLVLNVHQVGEINQEVTIAKANVNFPWVSNGVVYYSQGVATFKGGSSGISEQFFYLPSASAVVMVPNTAQNKLIGFNMRFYLGSSPFRVVAINDFALENIIVLILAHDEVHASDDRGIADCPPPTTLPLDYIDGPESIRHGCTAFYTYVTSSGVQNGVEWLVDEDFVTLTPISNGVNVTVEPNTYGNTFMLTGIKDGIPLSLEIKVTSLL